MSTFTQLEYARKGILTPQMKTVIKEEGIHPDNLINSVAEGFISIPANVLHTKLSPKGIGKGLKTKINVNIGISEDCRNTAIEREKIKLAHKYKADAIMDLSTYGDTARFRKKLIAETHLIVGTVPIYDALIRYNKKPHEITIDEWFTIVEEHGEQGVDFITIHAGLNLNSLERLMRNSRLTNVVSRGGSILMEWMLKNERENPFYQYFDRLCEIAKKYDITLSLGDGLRPGSLKDATDAAQIQELIHLGELTLKAREYGVQTIIEGPGHVPLNEIESNVLLQKKLCHGAPFYVLGPLVTDIAPGYDHITSAIGGAIAASKGADFLCYVTPAEHLRLPDLNDVKEGIIAAKIAAHVADIAKGIPGSRDWDDQMSYARSQLDWNLMYQLAIDEDKAKQYRNHLSLRDESVCSMCGEFCAVKRSNTLLTPQHQ